jgi:hypothetical protein
VNDYLFEHEFEFEFEYDSAWRNPGGLPTGASDVALDDDSRPLFGELALNLTQAGLWVWTGMAAAGPIPVTSCLPHRQLLERRSAGFRRPGFLPELWYMTLVDLRSNQD